jgi:hypothetical protein
MVEPPVPCTDPAMEIVAWCKHTAGFLDAPIDRIRHCAGRMETQVMPDASSIQ